MQNGAGMKAAQSLFIGARASIEHQIDIHTNDLAEGKTHQAFEPLEVLEGLRYVMEYRIRGGRLPNMDFSLMDRLLRVLLVNMKKREKHRFIEPGSTQEAVISLELFGKFLMEVEEFRDATVKMPHTFLAHHLDFGFWASHKRPDNVRRLAATVVTLLSNALKVYHTTYEDIVRPEDGGKVDRLLSEYPEAVSNPALQFASQSDEQVLPTPRLYTEKSPKKVVDMFGSNAELGLSQEQIERLSNRYGVNKLEPPPKVSKFTMIFNQLKDFMVVILIVMSIIEFSTGSYDSGIVLMVVIVFNTVIGFYLEYRADEALSALFDLSIPVTKVLRNGGVVSTISSELIVPGDIVILEEGDSAPADIRLIECFQLKVNESFLTGENVPVSKDPNPVTGSTLQLPVNKCKCIVFMSSTITSGRAKGIVVRIGSETEIGSIGTELSKKVSKKSRLQKELFTLGIYLVVGALILCAVNAIILISYQRPLYESIKVSVTLAVSVIPEGLVAIVTGTMFIAIQRMAKKNAIVKKVHLVETLGSVTTICTDKTGTLTRGLMSLRVIYTPDDKVYVFNTKRSHSGELFDELQLFNLATQDGLSPDSDILHRPEDASIVDEPNLDTMSIELNMLIICAVFCNNASVTRHPETGKTSYIGDPTEIALLTGAIKLGATRETLQKQASFELITEFAFDSDRKMMSVIYSVRFKHKSNEIKYFVLAKGASETICLRCTGCLDSRSQDTHGNSSWTMKATELTTTLKDNCDKISLLMANDGNRVLALAYKELSREDVRDIIENENVRKAESDLTLIGFVGLKDPPRPEVKDSVARCEKAGIKVVVITGDHAATAIAIAKQLDIYDPNILHKSIVMKGSSLSAISEQRLREMDIFPVLFARASPADKLKIVKALQHSGEIVAMIGDGVNDAPSVNSANVGISMSLTGTEITKQAADIVLADDNFNTIVVAVEEGRRVYDNIRKFLAYLVSCNTAEIILFLLTSALNYNTPFKTIQILWANIIADIPPAMSIGIEPAEKDVMSRPPRPLNSSVIDLRTAYIILIQSMIIAVPTFLLYIFANEMNIAEHQELVQRRTLSFACLTTLQMTQGLLSRSVLESTFKIGILGNKYLIWSFIISMGLMLVGIYAPVIREWLEFSPFSDVFWTIIVAFVVFQLVAVELTKLMFRSHPKLDVATRHPYYRV